MTTPENRSLDNTPQPPRIEAGNTTLRDSSEKTLGPSDSMASSPHTFHNALVAAKAFILNAEGNDAQIIVNTQNNPEATRWRKEASRLKTELQDPNVKKLFESKAATNAHEINEFLESKGFSIRLKDNGEGLYVASVFKQQVVWAEKGKSVTLNFMEDTTKPIAGVEMSKSNIAKYESGGNTIYKIGTPDGADDVYMMKAGNMKTTPIDLYQKIRDIHERKGDRKPGNDLRFPKVNLDEKGSIDWIVGAKVGSYTINQAEYQNKLQMDENGAVAEAAVAMSMSRGMSISKVDIIDGPMYVWFVKRGTDGKDVITFAARVGENAMVKKR